MIDALRVELFDLPDVTQFVRVVVRLTAAVLLGGLLGYEREREGKAAGFRTHMLVALGAALFTVGPLEAGMSAGDLSRVFQGIVTGIGFIGAGTILERADEQEIQGLTTAANLWFTAAVGMAVGLGHLWLPILGVVFALIILTVLGVAERGIRREREPADDK
jgi:putative Mg2+ transporter-C (MgtC) family protein